MLDGQNFNSGKTNSLGSRKRFDNRKFNADKVETEEVIE